MPTIGGRDAGCDLCAFRATVQRVEIDTTKPAGISVGSRRDPLTGEVSAVEHECRPCKTVAEWKCCADREPADFPAARICSRYQPQ